jgi:uncharacterized integral membrane protein
MTRAKLISGLVLALLLAGFSALFYYQNRAFEAEIGMNFGFWAGKIPGPVPVPVLVLLAGFSGLLLGWVWGSLRSFGLARRVKQLEAQQASAAIRQDDNW